MNQNRPNQNRTSQNRTSQNRMNRQRQNGNQRRNENGKKSSVSHDEAMIRRLRRHPDFAPAYLQAALEETDEPSVLLIALRHVAQARGVAKVAKAAGVERESLYRALSANGNPRLSTLYAVAKSLGLKLTLAAA